MMGDMEQIEAGLWRWTAPHPDWRPARKKDSAGDWPRDVGCVAVELGSELVLIDPLVDGEAQWTWLDERAAGRAVHVLQTSAWHKRSRDEVLDRYGDRADRLPPGDVEAIRVAGARETVYWLPGSGTLVPGDTLIGDETGGVRMCPESWLGFTKPRIGHAELRAALAPVLDLPVERVLVSHGEPVMAGGAAALRRALG
jgi:glyoxylase-like metal-dependent hydrolase (beta-lactamase superfamily II)